MTTRALQALDELSTFTLSGKFPLGRHGKNLLLLLSYV